MTIEMMRENWFAPNANLEKADERCAPLDYIIGDPRIVETDLVVSNNFAFGGINTSLIFKRWGNSQSTASSSFS
jgi:3-oxoacyl-[acyl-carrier-protein] synthase II